MFSVREGGVQSLILTCIDFASNSDSFRLSPSRLVFHAKSKEAPSMRTEDFVLSLMWEEIWK